MKAMYSVLAASVLFASAMAAAPAASAAPAYRYEMTHAPNACVPYNLLAPGNARYTPVAMKNKGPGPLNITCNLSAQYFGNSTTGVTLVSLQLYNEGNSVINVPCVLRPGYATSLNTTTDGAYSASTNVNPGSFAYLNFYPPSGTYFGTPNITCTLPVNGGLLYIYAPRYEEIGS